MTKMTNKQDELIIYEIPKDTNYWIVRANGGAFYNEFYLTGTISIGDNELELDNFKNIRNVKKFKEKVKDAYSKDTKSPQQIGIISNRLFRFIHKIKIGDIILVPGEKSQTFLLGIVSSDVKERSEDDEMNLSQQQIVVESSGNKKYREVKWLKTVDRKNISEKLLYVLTMHQSIIEIKNHTYLIDTLVSPIHVKNGKLNLSIYVNTEEDIDSVEWEKLFELINETKDIDERIITKANVQSIGLFTFTSLTFGTLLAIYAVIGEIDFSTNGIKLKGLLTTLNERKKEKVEIESLKIEKGMKELELKNKIREDKENELQHKINMNELKKKVQEIESNEKVEEIIKDFDMTIEIKKNEN